MHRVLAAPVTELFQFNLPLHKLFILAGIVIDPVAHRTLELDQINGILGRGHNGNYLILII